MGLSGADVSVRDALLEPVRALQAATHFRQGADGRWSLCGARARRAADAAAAGAGGALATPDVRAADFDGRSRACPRRPRRLRRHEEFRREYGS